MLDFDTDERKSPLALMKEPYLGKLAVYHPERDLLTRAECSRSEIAEMVAGECYSCDVAELVQRHERAATLCAAIYSNAPQEIERMLAEEPELALTTCAKSGQQPLHVAVACGRLPVIKMLRAAAMAAEDVRAGRRAAQEGADAQEMARQAELQREWREVRGVGALW